MLDFRLYLITDRKLFDSTVAFFTAIEEALKGGVRAVQLREKDLGTRDLLDMAKALRMITSGYDAKLFINDRLDVALAADADGVHLGAASIPAYAARKIVGQMLLIGVSAHGVEEAKKAEKEGADFITLGPVYETPSKAEYGIPLGVEILKKAGETISIPMFAIGGIRPDRVEEVMASGADGIALISAILAFDNIKSKSEEFTRLMK